MRRSRCSWLIVRSVVDGCRGGRSVSLGGDAADGGGARSDGGFGRLRAAGTAEIIIYFPKVAAASSLNSSDACEGRLNGAKLKSFCASLKVVPPSEVSSRATGFFQLLAEGHAQWLDSQN